MVLDLEWKFIYVGSAESESCDQELDCVMVGPVAVGDSKFTIEVGEFFSFQQSFLHSSRHPVPTQRASPARSSSESPCCWLLARTVARSSPASDTMSTMTTAISNCSYSHSFRFSFDFLVTAPWFYFLTYFLFFFSLSLFFSRMALHFR